MTLFAKGLNLRTGIFSAKVNQLVCGVEEGDSLSFAKHILCQLLGHLEETSVDMMEKEICEFVKKFNPKDVDFADLRSTYIANCVFNSFLSYTCIMLNIVTIHAIRKTSSLPNSLKTLLLSLAVSDVGVGLLGQPFYTSLLVKSLQQHNPDCNTSLIFVVIACVFFFAAFLSVVAVSVDRFLAIHLHLRYQELVTHKRVVAAVISIWALSVFLPLTMLWIPVDISTLVFLIVGVIGLLVTTVVYIRIYEAVQRHKIQIQAQQVQEEADSGEMANFASLIKSAVGVFFVYLVFMTCYLPYFISLVAFGVNGLTISLKRFSVFLCTLVYLNSTLNPVIYCWKMRHIRHGMVDILRNMSRFRNRGTHLS